MALPDSEVLRGLRRPQVPCRYLSHRPSGTRSGGSPSSHATISLSRCQSLSGTCSKTFLIALRKQILGVFIPKYGTSRTLWHAKLTASKYFPRIFPSFDRSLLRLVGGENLNMLHRTTHGVSRSYYRASEAFASCNAMVCSDTHTRSSRATSQTQLAAFRMDLNLKIPKFCMWFCPLRTTALV